MTLSTGESLSHPNWDYPRWTKSAGVWVRKIQDDLLFRAGEALTGDPVDGAEGPQHTHRSDGREAHVVSVQRVLHHAGGAGVLREGKAQRTPSLVTAPTMGPSTYASCQT